jgi:hypothetical protein
MFPNPKNMPAIFSQTTAGLSIPCRIPGNFILPVSPIVLWYPTVPFATVPETSINENGKTFTPKNKIRLAGKFQIPAPASDSI